MCCKLNGSLVKCVLKLNGKLDPLRTKINFAVKLNGKLS